MNIHWLQRLLSVDLENTQRGAECVQKKEKVRREGAEEHFLIISNIYERFKAAN